jgi:hypothetical protein
MEDIPYINLKIAAAFTFIARINRDRCRHSAPLYFCLMVGTLPPSSFKMIRKRNDCRISRKLYCLLVFPTCRENKRTILNWKLQVHLSKTIQRIWWTEWESFAEHVKCIVIQFKLKWNMTESGEQLGYCLLAVELRISCIETQCVSLAKWNPRLITIEQLRTDQQHTSPASRAPNKLPNQPTSQPLY